MTLQLPDSLYQLGIAIWGCNSWVRTKCSLVGWFYTHEQLLLDSKVKHICTRERKQLIRHNTHTHTQTHREERNRDYSANRGREKKERERKKARKKVAWEALLQGKDKAPCFRLQNHMTHSLQTHPTL
jgi:hypothetical protein